MAQTVRTSATAATAAMPLDLPEHPALEPTTTPPKGPYAKSVSFSAKSVTGVQVRPAPRHLPQPLLTGPPLCAKPRAVMSAVSGAGLMPNHARTNANHSAQ